MIFKPWIDIRIKYMNRGFIYINRHLIYTYLALNRSPKFTESLILFSEVLQSFIFLMKGLDSEIVRDMMMDS